MELGKLFLFVALMAALASVGLRLFITNANATARKVGLNG